MSENNLTTSAFRVKNLLSKFIKDNELSYYFITSLPENNPDTFIVVLGDERYVFVNVKTSRSVDSVLDLSFKAAVQCDWTEPSDFSKDLKDLKNFLLNYK